MEMLMILLLLTYAEKDGEFKKRLLGVLSFYRENRELFLALSGHGQTAETNRTESAAAESEQAQKFSPPDGGENLHVLEEFLKRV